MQLQKEVKSVKCIVKKDVKSRMTAKNGCDGRLIRSKNLNKGNSGEFGAKS